MIINKETYEHWSDEDYITDDDDEFDIDDDEDYEYELGMGLSHWLIFKQD